ncbi:hypothetical protein OQA88_10323 [Cercophora sp. LCS_1]
MICRSYQLAAAAAIFLPSAKAEGNYSIVDVFSPSNFFTEFEFNNNVDQNHGFVQYLDAPAANREGLAGYAQGAVYLGVDYKNPTTTGRASVRVESKKHYNKGLFIADIAHMPSTAHDGCGLWPAFWTYSPGGHWPDNGEIDIIEGVNTETSNNVVLHTGYSCRIDDSDTIPTTTSNGHECQGSVGCRQQAASSGTWGARFNEARGGVYAMEWTDRAILTWFFPRNSAMASKLSRDDGQAITDTLDFGQPLASFVGGSGCSITDNFKDQVIVFNINFCGDWAGKDWNSRTKCIAHGLNCNDYVAANPSAFEEAYWLINSVRVYQQPANQSITTTKRGVRFAA